MAEAVTVRSVITSAFRQSGRRSYVEELEAEDADEGLEKLQTIIDGLANGGAFGRLRATLITGDTTAEEQSRIASSDEEDVTITLPATLEDARSPVPYGEEQVSSLAANVDYTNRAPRDHALVEVAGADQVREVYDALRGQWLRIDALALTDDLPLARWRGEFIAMLVPAVAIEPTAIQLANAARAKYRLLSNPTAPRSETEVSWL